MTTNKANLQTRFSSIRFSPRNNMIDPQTPYTCSCCGHHPVKTHFCEPTRSEMLAKQVCFTCHFWLEIIDNNLESPKNKFVIDNNHYTVLPNDPHPMALKGFGGRRFIIQPNDNSPRVVTCNLWHQGEVPERFRDRLPNNAVFVRE